MAHFYYPALHSRLRHGDAAAIFEPNGWLRTPEAYQQHICSCRQCAELIHETGSVERAFEYYGESQSVTFKRRGGGVARVVDYPTAEARQAAAQHYLFNKAREFADLQSNALDVLLNRLRVAREALKTTVGEMGTMHLLSWNEGVRAVLRGQ